MKHILAAALMFVSGAAFADTYKGTGEAAIENGNKKLAREQALESAMRDAVIKGAGATIDTATLTEGGTLLQDKIFVHANGYVQKYDVSEDREDDGVWRVSIDNVQVSKQFSDDVAGVRTALLEQGAPRIYVLLREQSLENLGNGAGKDKPATLAQLSQGVVEQRMSQNMTQVGWKFVDPQVASGKVHVENALTTDLQSLNGKDFAVTGADYVVLGSVVVRPASPENGQKDLLDGVTLRAVAYIKSTDTGDTVASVEYTKVVGSAMGVNGAATKALEIAGDEITKSLCSQVYKKWNDNRMGVGNLHLMVSVNDYDVLQAFEEQLQKSVANVKSVEEVSFNDGKADLSVHLTGTNPKALANSLSNKTVKGNNVKVVKVTTNTVEVKLVR